MKRVSLGLAASLFVLASALYAAEAVKLEGVKCPVGGPDKAAKADQSISYKGGKVYFCCGGCAKAFEKETAKFASKANHQLVATGQVKQAKCPLTGGPAKEDKTVEIAGAKVQFCCDGCKGKVAKAKPEEQLEMVFADAAFEKGGFAVPKK